jgi:NAD(P)-dependent dehydrogenase (short-subunit alcohol dehydrogenase family)
MTKNGKRVAWVTGGGSGIGEAGAEALAADGWTVVVSGRRKDALDTVVAKITKAGGAAEAIALDVSVAAAAQKAADQIVAKHGRIDLLVNNAAHQASFSSIDDISDDEWDITFRTNVYAMFYLTKAAIPHMKQGSAIINTTSVNADTPSPQLLAYATTKGAIQNFTGGLAQLVAEKAFA